MGYAWCRDVTKPETLSVAMTGVTTVLCAVGAFSGANATEQEAIEFTGVENQVAELAKVRRQAIELTQ